jgi:hypothetical protein
MSMKVVLTTSLVVGLTVSVAHAQESAPMKEECPTPDQFKAAGATGPTNVDIDVPECPPVQQVSAPLPPPILPVSAPEPAPRFGPEPVAYRDEEITSYLQLAPKNAFEIGFQGGYFQPFGDLMKDTRISNITDAGGEVGLDLGWRIGPMGAIGVVGRFHESVVDDQFADSEDMAIRGGAVGFQGTVHFAPYMAADPYLTMGAGYRTLWLVPQSGESNIFHGVELARVQLGLDLRVARDFSIGPNAGAAVNMFVAEAGPSNNRFNPSGDNVIDDPRPSAMIFAGMAGRFEVGGSRVSEGVYYGRYPRTREYTASRF